MSPRPGRSAPRWTRRRRDVVTSTKSMTGHLPVGPARWNLRRRDGAARPHQPPTINLDNEEPDLGIDIAANRTRQLPDGPLYAEQLIRFRWPQRGDRADQPASPADSRPRPGTGLVSTGLILGRLVRIRDPDGRRSTSQNAATPPADVPDRADERLASARPRSRTRRFRGGRLCTARQQDPDAASGATSATGAFGVVAGVWRSAAGLASSASTPSERRDDNMQRQPMLPQGDHPAEDGAPVNILIRTDSRGAGDQGRSDVLMMAHVRGDRKTVYLISFPRDLWVNVPAMAWPRSTPLTRGAACRSRRPSRS